MSANTQTVASLFADYAMAQTLNGEWLELAQDRADFENSPIFFKSVDSVLESATGTKRIRLLGLGRGGFTQVADGVAGVYSALEREYVDVAVARWNLNYSGTSFADMIDPDGMLKLPMLTRILMNARRHTVTNGLVNLFGAFNGGTSLGTTTVDFGLSTFLAAKQALELNELAASALIGHTKMITDLQNALANATGGAVQWMQATADLISARGANYKGQYLGVDLYQSTACPTANAGADYRGCMLAQDAVAIAHGTAQIEIAGQQILVAPDLKLEWDRQGISDTTNFPANMYLGFAETGDDRGIPVIGSAT